MKIVSRFLKFLTTGMIVLSPFMEILCEEKNHYLSPLVLAASKDGTTLYVSEFTAKQVAEFDIETQKVTNVISLPEHPSGLTVSPDGLHLYVTGAAPAGEVYVINLQTGKIRHKIAVGHFPNSPLISPDGRILYVNNRFDNTVTITDLITQKKIGSIPVNREPVASVMTPDGNWLYIANMLPAGSANEDYAAAAVSVITTHTLKVETDILLPNGSTGLRDICISPDGRYVYVTHVLARYQLPTTQLERGWMNTNAVTIIDVRNQLLINTVLLDDNDLGAANPWGVDCTKDGKYICVSHSGTDEISIIDRVGLHEKITNTISRENIPNDFSFLTGIRQRLKLQGKGPRDLILIGRKAYIAEYFSNSIGVVDIYSQIELEADSFLLGLIFPETVQRRGEIFFHDASKCFQQWQSCASCHPGSGRTDGLNWDLLNDGIGNPKNTKSLLLSHKTPPTMITGIRERAEVCVRSGIRFILLSRHSENDAVSIDEYLKSLKPVPSPYLVNGELNRSAERGKVIFEKSGCISCHPPPLYTGLQKYDVGVGDGREKSTEFDTPTLVEVWRTAPYLYDGRAVTIEDVLTKYNSGDKHGITSILSEKEIHDLVEFILSL